MYRQWSLYVPPVVTICTTQWSLYVPHSGQYMYHTVVNICTAQWSLYVPPVVSICTTQWSVYVPHSGQYMYHTVVSICTAQWSQYVPPGVTICTASLTFSNSTFCPHSCIYVFCVDLRTNSDYFTVQRELAGCYNRDRVFTARYGLGV